MFTLKTTSKAAVGKRDRQEDGKASDPSVRFLISRIMIPCNIFIVITLLYQTGLEDNSVGNLSLEKV